MRTPMIRSSLALALLSACGMASAAIAPKDLEVTGTVKTPTCVVSSDKDGVYDYGKVNASLIPTTGYLTLSTIDQVWTVDCGSGKTFMSFQVVDNREASSSSVSSQNFGLGAVAGFPTSKLGYFTVTLNGAKVDQANVNVLRGTKGAASGTGAASTFLDKTLSHSWTTSGTTGALPLSGSVFSMGLRVSAFVASETVRGAPITEGTPLDGNLTLNYAFGL
ncbi:hypothetical protein [uncultured Stenotrophomonas sp.]|uniref:hypothetical protein n=1 Tax=Stenotrophomonas sp. NRRL B-14846 TaxID=3162882 RepID=UPI0025D5AA0D|nr:hypothetical protein [uncultured Stenotrophomonas sp.]